MLDKLPAELVAGDTWAWTRDLPDYPAPTWDATVYFENAAGTFSAAATDSDTAHAFSIDAATTLGKKAGRYRWSVRVTDGTTVSTVESGWVEVRIDPAAAGNSDPRSYWRKLLDAIDATLLSQATSGQLAMSLNGRSISRIPFNELSQERDKIAARVRAEESGAPAASRRTIKLRFRSA